MTTSTLHKLPEGFIITSDEEIKENDAIIYPIKTTIPVQYLGGDLIGSEIKVIAQQDQIDFSALSEEEQKEIGWFDVMALAEAHGNIFSLHGGHRNYAKQGYLQGFQKAQELLSDRKFTLEDIVKIVDELWNEPESCKDWFSGKMSTIEAVQSLSQPQSWKVELEMEYMVGISELTHGNSHITPSLKPKLTDGKVKILKLL